MLRLPEALTKTANIFLIHNILEAGMRKTPLQSNFPYALGNSESCSGLYLILVNFCHPTQVTRRCIGLLRVTMMVAVQSEQSCQSEQQALSKDFKAGKYTPDIEYTIRTWLASMGFSYP